MADNLYELDIIRHCGTHHAELNAAGYDIVAPSDFADIGRMVDETGRRKQTPMMALNRNDFTRRDAFWLFLLHNGKPVAGTAARYTDLSGEPFQAYMRRTSREQYRRDKDPIVSIAEPVLQNVSGRLIYLGELELHPQHRGKVKLLYRFVRVLMGMAALKWPDFNMIYAFVPKEHVKLTDGYGFTWKVPRAITWTDPVPKGRLNDHWLVGTSRSDFLHAWSGKYACLLYTSPSPRDRTRSRMPSSA